MSIEKGKVLQDYQLLEVYNCDEVSQEEAYDLFPGDFNSKKQPRADRPNRGQAAFAFDKTRPVHASIKVKGRQVQNHIQKIWRPRDCSVSHSWLY